MSTIETGCTTAYRNRLLIVLCRQWRQRIGGKKEYYAAIAVSNASGTCEAFVAFMLEVIRDSIPPYAVRKSGKDVRKEQLLEAVSDDPRVTVLQLMEKTGFSRHGIERDLAELKESGMLARSGSARSGSWEVNR